MSVLNLMIGRCDHAEFLYRLPLTKRTELREVTLHGWRALYAYFSMTLNVLSACHSIGTLRNSTTESSSLSRLDWRSSCQPKRLTSSSTNSVQVLRLCDSHPGPTNGFRAKFNHEVRPQSVRNDFIATEYLLRKEKGRAVRWSSCTFIRTTLPLLQKFWNSSFGTTFRNSFTFIS
jgi:hypothetical protein